MYLIQIYVACTFIELVQSTFIAINISKAMQGLPGKIQDFVFGTYQNPLFLREDLKAIMFF